MAHHRAVWASAALVAALVASLLVPAGAAGAGGHPPATPLSPAPGPEHRIGAPLAAATGPVTAFVELTGTPAAEAFDTARARSADTGQAARAARLSRRDTGERADRVVRALRAKDSRAREVATTANAVPGVVVTADAAGVRELAALPEVRSVRLAVRKKVGNAGAARLTRAAGAWQRTGRFGEGVRIGVVDTGIDYTHADFGGAGTEAAHDAVDRTGSWTPTAKVVGGHDFAGDDYDPDDAAKATPRPDADPMDCQGHGTHVAGSAAGYGVNADGSPFTGDYRALTPEALDAMRIGPGSAPRALLYALKVFGCAGATDLASQALDWALDPDGDGDFSDRLDVVNLSLGNEFGGRDDPDNLFVRELVRHGVVVVAAAGNGGDFYDVGGSPANAPEALAVANTRDASAVLDGVEAPGLGRLAGQYSKRYPRYDDLDLTRPVVRVAEESNADGCAPIAQDLSDRFVWLDWDDDATRECGTAARTDHAEAAGAAGVLLPTSLSAFAAAIAGNAGIPAFQLTAAESARLRPALEAGGLRVRMAGALRDAVTSTTPALADTITPSSSRGSRGRGAVKPDVAAPGDTISSAEVGTGSGAVGLSGTSMAAPHVAGIAALVREAHPDWTVEEVKAAVVNTATGDVTSGDDHATGLPEAPMRVGAGRVDALAAVGADLLAAVADDPGSVGVSFGPVEVDRPLSLTRTVDVVNKGAAPRAVAVSYQPVTSVPGARVEVRPPVVSVAAGQRARVRVVLRLEPGALRKVADPTVAKEQGGHPRQFLAEVSGRVELRAGGTALRVPVYAAPKPVADVVAEDVGGELRLSGRGLRQGSGDAAYRSLASVFELHGSSGRLPDCTDRVRVDCAVNETARGGDLRHVGAAAHGGLVAFGVATWHRWVTLGANGSPEVRVDTTGDGRDDYRVRVVKPTDPAGSVTADVWLARTVRLADQEVVDEQPVNGQYGDVDTNVMDSDVVVLPVALSALGISPSEGSHPITYTVITDGLYPAPGGQVVDRIGTPMAFDPLRPAVAARDGIAFVAEPGAAIAVDRAPGAPVLVLHHHNAGGRRAQVLPAG